MATVDERTALLGTLGVLPTQVTLGDEEQQLQPDCPMTPSDTAKPFPWRPVLSILFLFGVQPLGYEIIFPFINQMIVENGVVTDPERVGFYSGVIESIFALMSFVSIMPCSYLSDHAGRKPVILIGTAGLAVSIGLFGVAKSYWFMIATRCIGGTLGGTIATMRVMLAETVDKSQQGLAFTGFAISYRLGQIVGQPLGGLLSHPERHMPMFDTLFWREYPFALPCFLSSAFALCAVILGYFTVDETSPRIRRERTRQVSDTVCPSEDGTCRVEALKKERPSLIAIMTPHVVSSLVTCTTLALSSEMVFAVYSLFAFTPIVSGGLGFSEAQIGLHLGVRSLVYVGVMLFYTPVERHLGTVRTHQLAMAFWPVTVAFFPLLNALARRGWEGSWTFNAASFLFFIVWGVAGFSWTSSGIIINDASPSAEALSTINGISMMVSTLSLAIGPAFVTSLFAFSIKSNILDGNLVWAVSFALGCAGALHSLILGEPTHDWRQE